jgi:hypothetical protein
MKIKTDELKRFLSAAGQIKPNPTATNLDSIKIECTGQEVVFIKTNNNIWCRYSYVCQPQQPEKYLITEKILNGLALTSKEYEIDVSLHIDGHNVVLTSGEDSIKTTNQDLKLFPVIQTPTGERVKISKEVVDRIRIASKYVNSGVAMTAFNFVSVGMQGIFASNGSIVYYHNTFPLPEIMLDQEPLNTIKGNDDMLYWSSEGYNFFQCEGFTYGFIKTVISPLAYMPIVNQTGTDSFTCKRDDMLDFCTLVYYSKKQENPLATFSGSNQMLMLRYEDSDFNINVSRNIPMECTAPVEQFRFSVDWLGVMLKTLPYELLTFTRVPQGHYIVTTQSDPDYKGIIARLAD